MLKPTIAQYPPKYFKLLFFTIKIIHLQAITPVIKAKINPIKREINEVSE